MGVQVLEKSSSGINQISLDSKHMSERRLFISGEITEEAAMDFMKQVMYLNDEDDKSPITVCINTEGGKINSGLLMYDVIVGSRAPIHMYCTGKACSMGAILFSCADKRFLLPNSELMIHQPLLAGGVSGNADSIKSISDSLLKRKEQMNRILALHTGKTEEEISKESSYDHFFTAREAVDFGLADGIKTFREMMEGV